MTDLQQQQQSQELLGVPNGNRRRTIHEGMRTSLSASNESGSKRIPSSQARSAEGGEATPSNLNSSLSIVNIAVESSTHAKPKFVGTVDENSLRKGSQGQQDGTADDGKQGKPSVTRLSQNRRKTLPKNADLIDEGMTKHETGNFQTLKVASSDAQKEPPAIRSSTQNVNSELAQSSQGHRPSIVKKGNASRHSVSQPQKCKKPKDLLTEFDQAQQIGTCTCPICKRNLRQLKGEGLDPLYVDVVKQNEKHAKFIEKQVFCNEKMKKLYQDIKKSQAEMKKNSQEGESLQKGILREMDRIKQINSIKFKKGDHFIYEEHDYNWLLQKLAGTPESTHYGCPINITETILFINGKPQKIIKTTKDDNQVNQTRGHQMGNLELRKFLQGLVGERNKDYQRKLQQMKFEEAARLKKLALQRAQQKMMQASKGSDLNVASNASQDSAQPLKKRQSSIGNDAEKESNHGGGGGGGGPQDSAAKTSAPPPSSQRQESQIESLKRRDAYLMRFKKGAERKDKVILESDITRELEHKSSSSLWKELTSISLTPNAKTGLGKLFTFEFIAPCFETDKPKSQHDAKKKAKMSYYGRVKFDFAQFGPDDKLRKQSPLQYCIKMCHIIGFYVQGVHGYEVMKMKVDFNQDEFGEIWLMNVQDLCVRKSRYVPSDNGTQLADYVLRRMEEIKNKEDQEKMDIEKNEIELMAETSLNETPAIKRAKSIATGETARMIGSRESAFNRMHTAGSQISSPQRKRYGPTAGTSQEKFRRMHPQQFSSFIDMPSSSLMLEESLEVGTQQLYNSEMQQKESQLQNNGNVHKINQLRELRIQLNKIRSKQGTAPTRKSSMAYPAQHYDAKQIPLLSLDANVNESYAGQLRDSKIHNSTPSLNYDQRVAKTTVARAIPYRSQQRSVKEISQYLYEESRMKEDCAEYIMNNNRKSLQGMRTTCPLLKQEQVINSVYKAANVHQKYRKSRFFHIKTVKGGGPGYSKSSMGAGQTSQMQSAQQQSRRLNKSTARADSIASSPQKNLKKGFKSQSTLMGTNTLRESTAAEEEAAENPFTSGVALQRFELKAAQKKQHEEIKEGSSVIVFRDEDLGNPRLRDFSRESKSLHKMKKTLFDQQQKMQMNCDFLLQPSTDSINSIEMAKREVSNIEKYREEEADFAIRQAETSNKFVKEYQEHQQRLETELALIRAQGGKPPPHNDSILDLVEVAEEVMMNEGEGAQSSSQLALGSKQPSAQQLQHSGSKRPVMDVVTSLGHEDFSGMPNQKARKIAAYIANVRDLNSRGSHDAGSSPQQQRAMHQAIHQSRQQLYPVNPGSLYNEGRPETIWQSRQPVRSSQRSRRAGSKPMSNQQARAIVQREFYLSRSNNSLLPMHHNGTFSTEPSNLDLVGSMNVARGEGQRIHYEADPQMSYLAGVAEGLENRAATSHQSMAVPSHFQQYAVGAHKPSHPVKPHPTSALKSSHMTTHCGTFGALSSSVNAYNRGTTASDDHHPFSVRASLASAQNESSATQKNNLLMHQGPAAPYNHATPGSRRNIKAYRNQVNNSQLTEANPHLQQQQLRHGKFLYNADESAVLSVQQLPYRSQVQNQSAQRNSYKMGVKNSIFLNH